MRGLLVDPLPNSPNLHIILRIYDRQQGEFPDEIWGVKGFRNVSIVCCKS